VSGPSAEHLRRLTSGLGAVPTGRRTFDVAHGWGGNHPSGPAFVLTHHTHPAGGAPHQQRRAQPGRGAIELPSLEFHPAHRALAPKTSTKLPMIEPVVPSPSDSRGRRWLFSPVGRAY